MQLNSRKARFYFLAFLKHDFRASITVFFVALPLCLGISLASGTSFYSGIVAGIIGGILISLISKSHLSVSGPAAGLTAICASTITELGSVELFFLSVTLAGLMQIMLGVFKLGGFTAFIPSSVIKGMLTAIGIILISKQIPLIIGYNKPDFWTHELFNIITFRHAFEHIDNLYHSISAGAIIVSVFSIVLLFTWRKYSKSSNYIPASFITVLSGGLLAWILNSHIPALKLSDSLFVNIPENVFSQVTLPDFGEFFSNIIVWKNSVVIFFIATLETLLSIEAIDKLDPYNRITPQNRELIAQGTGNAISGLVGGLPITAVIVRSSANAEAGAKTKLSSISHGLWLILAILFAIPILNKIPYCVLAVVLIRTGYNLAKPKMIRSVYRQGREQFMPFLITVISILFIDLLIGVLIGILYAIYFIVKHTYRAGYNLKTENDGHIKKFVMELALNVSFLNKKKIKLMLDELPEYSIVEIIGTKSVYIDLDILEILKDFKTKAHNKHIQLVLIDIPDVETIELHG
jgi:MFS superfamily sulfate permease-like transporter